MAGHNKWSKVKHIKARVDAKRGKLFSRFAQEISIVLDDYEDTINVYTNFEVSDDVLAQLSD